MNMKRKEGITLIALVITIIVLLILAGVSIAMLTGQNGILSQAQNAKNKTELSSEKEQIKLAVQASITKNPDTLEITKTNLEEGIQEQLGNNREFETTDNQDGSFIVNLKNPDKMYYVEETGKVIAEENMLKISTVDELKAFRDNVNKGNTYEGWYVYLANDISLNEDEQWEPIGLYLNEATSPEDSRNTYFSGIFDGTNHYIKGININTTNKVQGLFGLNQGGTIKNLQVLDCNITGGIATGGIVGYNYNNSKIYNCSVSGIITSVGTQMVGGISGNNIEKSIIEKCFNLSSISGKAVIGGITGYQSNGSTVNSCFNSGNITGTTIVGGILGQNTNLSEMKNCYNIGNVTGNSNTIGGILGNNTNATAKNSYVIANIDYNEEYLDYSGYIVGTNSTNGQIFNCSYLVNDEKLNPFGTIEAGSRFDAIAIENQEQLLSIINSEKAFKEDTNNINNGYPILKWQ